MTIGLGIECTTHGARSQPKSYSKYAGICETQTLAWWTSQLLWNRRDLAGRLRPLLSTPTIGLQKREVKTVTYTHSVQGFLRLLLNEGEAIRIMEIAKNLNRYLIPVEVSRILRRDIKQTVMQEEENRMQDVWVDFCKENNIDQGENVCNVEILEKWWSWVPSHYINPLPAVVASPWDN